MVNFSFLIVWVGILIVETFRRTPNVVAVLVYGDLDFKNLKIGAKIKILYSCLIIIIHLDFKKSVQKLKFYILKNIKFLRAAKCPSLQKSYSFIAMQQRAPDPSDRFVAESWGNFKSFTCLLLLVIFIVTTIPRISLKHFIII